MQSLLAYIFHSVCLQYANYINTHIMLCYVRDSAEALKNQY